MRTIRIYHPFDLTAYAQVILTAKASHHLVHVLRAPVGRAITLFNGKGGQFHATISAVSRNRVTVVIDEFSADDSDSPLDLTLAQGIVKGERMDWIIQKATELGVKRVVALETRYSIVKLDSKRQQNRLQHWQSIAAHACEQCGRNRLPTIEAFIQLQHWVSRVADTGHRLLMDPTSVQPVSKIINSRPSMNPITLLVGPEGGFSDNELLLAKQHGFCSIKLGNRVLRSETAAISAVAILQAYYGDL